MFRKNEDFVLEEYIADDYFKKMNAVDRLRFSKFNIDETVHLHDSLSVVIRHDYNLHDRGLEDITVLQVAYDAIVLIVRKCRIHEEHKKNHSARSTATIGIISILMVLIGAWLIL